MTAEPVVWERIRRDRCEALEAVARAAKVFVYEVNEGRTISRATTAHAVGCGSSRGT